MSAACPLKYIPEHERAGIPAEDFAGPDRSFPIRNQNDLENAARLIGHAADPEKVKARAKRIAKRKGLTLPESWQTESESSKRLGLAGETVVYRGGEVKSLGDDRVGGYLVVFSTEKDPDLSGDFFTK